MWSLMAFCLACTMVTDGAREQHAGPWPWWLDAESVEGAWKRSGGGGPSLSIVNPLDVLRQRLQLETARRRQQENEQRIRDNEMLLRNLGKRRHL